MMVKKRSKGSTAKWWAEVRVEIFAAIAVAIVFLILFLIVGSCRAEYIVYDPYEDVRIDYGHQTNYIRSLEERIHYLKSSRTNVKKVVVEATTNFIKEECEPTWWEENDGKLGIATGGIVGTILWFLISSLF